MDTPGVMLPNVPNEEVGMRLALTGKSLTHAAIRVTTAMPSRLDVSVLCFLLV